MRLRRDSKPVVAVERFLAAHKVVAAALALIILGATAATVLSAYASKDDVRALRVRDDQIERQVQQLREVDVEIRSAVKAIAESTQNTRADVKELLKHVLANPSK